MFAWLIAILRTLPGPDLPAYFSHGRYILIAISPIALLMVRGLDQWIPDRFSHIAGMVFVLALVAYDAICFWGFLVPYYY